jgi:hypothetical protein
MLAVIVSLTAIVAALCAAETIVSRIPRLDAWLDRFLGGNDFAPQVLTPEEFHAKYDTRS